MRLVEAQGDAHERRDAADAHNGRAKLFGLDQIREGACSGRLGACRKGEQHHKRRDAPGIRNELPILPGGSELSESSCNIGVQLVVS